MNALMVWLTSPEWMHVVKALLHTLWQGALVALLLAAALRCVVNPIGRYRCALGALAAVLITALATWAFLVQPQPPSPAVTSGEPMLLQTPAPSIEPSIQSPIVSTAVAANSVKPPHPGWTAWLALVWMAGALLMLARAGWQVAGAERLRRSTMPLENPTVTKLLQEARAAVRLTRSIQIAVTDRLTSPAVVGVLVPTLILPLSLVTTLTPEQLRFVLLHELAHIRRGDYLANLFQLLVEALLFFNPAVWWISHQVRREREACCDALAISLSGQPADYARTLVRVAESVFPAPQAALAFGERRSPSSLAERVQRLLVPGYRPSLRLTWRAMLLALGLGSVLLFLSAAATRVTVAAIMGPRERMAHIEKRMAEYGVTTGAPENESARHKVMVTGRLRTADGAALPRRPTLIIVSHSGNNVGSYSARAFEDGTFSNAVPSGTIWVEAHHEDFAPAVSGPFEGTGTNAVDAGQMVLGQGFELTVQLTDAESGQPVTNAAVSTAFILRPAGLHLQRRHEVITDTSGQAALSRCVDQPLQVTVNAAGYEVTEQQFSGLTPGQTLEVKLRTGAPIVGRVVDKTSGTPIAGAVVRLIHESAETDRHFSWTDNKRILARTDESGRFSVTQLRKAVKYWLGVSAPGHESIIVNPQTSGDWVVALGPELIVRGRVLGNLDALQRVRNKPVLYASVSEQIGNSSYGSGEWVDIHMMDGAARFSFTNRVGGPVTLTGTGYREKREVSAPIDDWVVNLAVTSTNAAERYLAKNLPQREVIFRLTNSSGVTPSGTVRVVIPEDLDPEGRSSRSEELAITNGEVRVRFAIGGDTSIEPRRMPGFWFNSSGPSKLSQIRVTNGEGPMVIEIPLVPAGAIFATASNADGSAAGGLFFGIHELKRAPSRESWGSLGNDGDSVSGEAPRKWVSGPLPLGGTYQVHGWRGNSFCVSAPITLTAAKPDATVDLRFGPARTLAGVVLGPDGEPIRDARLEANFSLENGHGFGLRPVFTDEQGRFRLENATPELGQYAVQISAPGVRAETVKLTTGVQPKTIRLKRGLVLAGRVVEAGTGHVLPDIEVRAVDLDSLKLPEQKTRTDSEGRFKFTTLGDVSYSLYMEAGSLVASKKFRPGAETNVTVPIQVYAWSKVKPKPAGDQARSK